MNTATAAERIFTPVGSFIPGRAGLRSHVKRWTWTARGGLRVEYVDGLCCRSAWGSLPEFLRAVAEQREVGVIETKAEDA
jgi:hypothetical protein